MLPEISTDSGTPAPLGYTADGSPRVSSYFPIVGPAPTCGPGDHATALAFLHRVEQAITQGGWTAYERNRLQKLQVKWGRRAFGKDPRFELVGTAVGRLPAQVEYALRPKQRRALTEAEDEIRRNGRHKPQDQRHDRERRRRWLNLDLPVGEVKGGSGEPEADLYDPECGPIDLPPVAHARQYLIPGQDGKGHAHRVYCRVMPAHFRAIAALERNRAFGFRTIGDVIRWCIDHGVRELSARASTPQVISALAQVDAIREILIDEQYYLEFPQIFEQMSATVQRHLAAGAQREAVRLVAVVRHQIEQMQEDHWREKYMTELMRQFGHLLEDASGVGLGEGGEQR